MARVQTGSGGKEEKVGKEVGFKISVKFFIYPRFIHIYSII